MSNPKVLIVDDDDMNVALLEMMLMEEGLSRIDMRKMRSTTGRW